MNKRIKKTGIIAAAILCLFAIKLFAQESEKNSPRKLTIGDPAPKLSYSKWIQGDPRISELAADKIYVIEFWATWCGPCIAAMPHLSELSKKYKGKIDFIGCDVWESEHGGNKNQEFYYDKVSGFVKDKSKSGKLTYNVITDNNAEDMGNNWLKAAGIDGIPSSFVIDKGKIAWIGHPYYLDSVLVDIEQGKYDPAKELEKQNKQAQELAKYEAVFKAVIDEYKAAETAKNYDKALVLMDNAIAKFPENSFMFVTDKFMLLLEHYSEDKAIAYGWELQKTKLDGQVVVANVVMKDGLSKRVYEFAAEAMIKWEDTEGNSKVLGFIASTYLKSGNIREAVEYQKKTVAAAKADKSEYAPTASEIVEYEKILQEYSKKLSKK
ncbi:TlpA disulfide reductase family protein [Labilibaculum manganireducens]|uniref:TlpA family protein disulfide reductase n=1 Tax=Labilibaculum manganireducens TaxID=1940525 RepID=UPI0029F4BD05|nr:TlpA disulfide reductase family protein [Labilibaculum manganireducens]